MRETQENQTASTPSSLNETKLLADDQPVGLQWKATKRSTYFLTGIVYPICCLGTSLSGVHVSIDKWQSGTFEMYCSLLLERPAIVCFIPLLTLSMAAMAICCIQPQRAAASVWIRTGIYAGVALSIQFQILVIAVSAIASVIAACVVALAQALLIFIARKFGGKVRQVSILQIMLLTSAIAVAMALGLSRHVASAVQFVYFVIIVGAAPLAVVTYLRAAGDVWILPNAEAGAVRTWSVVAATAWVSTYFASWKIAMDVMLAEYAKLPTSPPNCYVSAAAAYGHPQLVGRLNYPADEQASSNIANRGGLRVNRQMCRLKLLEFSLAACSPRAHATVRRFYNRFGPMLARWCQSSIWFADLTYIALKPLELLAQGVIKLSGIRAERVDRVFHRLLG